MPGPQRRRRARRLLVLAQRRLARHGQSGRAGRVWSPRPQGRSSGGRWRGPALHLLVAVAPLLVVLLLVHGPPQLVWAPAALVVASVTGLVVRRQRQRRYEARWTAAQQRAESVLELIWEDWVDAEAERGVRELERWRRTRNS